MSLRVSFGTLASDQKVGGDLPKEDTPLRIAVLGDFSGRSARGLIGSAEEVARRRARKVDRGSLDDLIAKSAPTLKLDLASGSIELAFRSLDDFHPDALHGRVAAFGDCFDRDEKTALMNTILHHPAYQGLESAWRGVDWLLQGIARLGPVEVRLIDLSADELIADLSATDRLEESGLYQILVDQPASKGDLDPWSVLVGLYLFEPTAAHASILGRIGRIARQASAPFVSGATPGVLAPAFAQEDDDAEAWGGLRQLPESSLLGLVAPRFLLRAPYGEASRTIDAFDDYEEFDGPTSYLWGSSALAVAVVLTRSFAKEGWALKPGSVLDLGGMAMHVTRDEDDEPVSVMAEVRLVRPSADRLAALGLMPLLCVKGRDTVELGCVQSLAKPVKGASISPLVGRWGQKGSVNLPKSGVPGEKVAATAAAAAPSVASPPAQQAAPVASETEEHEPAVSEEMDPELAAMMAELGAPATAEEPESVSEEMDPELAALMAELDAPAAVAEPEAAVSEEMDPELAALMAELDAPAAAEAAVSEEMDPELAALMAELDAPAAAAEPEAAVSEEMDPELAALMAELDNPAPDSEPESGDEENQG